LRYQALASDYDGTLAQNGRVELETIGALEAFRDSGGTTLLVTGRQIGELQSVFDRIDLFDCIVGENGALLYWPESGETELLAPPPSLPLVTLLRARGVEPLVQGQAILASLTTQEAVIIETLHEEGLDLTVILNKESLMVLPRGIDKASGLTAALARLGLAADTVAGIGDAENDLSFLRLCGYSAAVANALPELKAETNLVTNGAFGQGVAELAALLAL